MTATPAQIQQLKENWKHDPCWEIEDTPGFEEHRAELLAWRQQYEADIERQHTLRIERRREMVCEQTGIINPDTLDAVFTWQDIEGLIGAQEQYIGSFETREAIVTAELQIATIRATLLQAAQLKRIADSLEAMGQNSTFEFSTELWKVNQ